MSDWQEPTRRSGTPISANNPFRQSMLLRSESPVQQDSIYALYSRSASSLNDQRLTSASPQPQTQASEIPIAPRSRQIQSQARPGSVYSNEALRRSSNPFLLDDAPVGSPRLVNLEPPPAYDDRPRSNSDSSAMGESEKQRLARYDAENSIMGETTQRRYPSTRQYQPESKAKDSKDSKGDLRDRERQLAARERRYREEHERLRAEREQLRAERHRLRGNSERPRERSERSDRERTDRERSDRPRERSDRERSERSDRERSDRERSDRPRERTERDRSERERRSTRARSKSESSKRPRDKDGRPLDVIDKMDVTGLFGPGSFHHDGPFDACTPHRNNNAKKAAPIQAYAADGPNNSLAIVDPNIGNYKKEQTVFGNCAVEDAVMAEPSGPERHGRAVHGPSSLGLGSTTFLDGVPASNAAVVEASRERSDSGNLGRSKSILRRQNSRLQRPNLEIPPRPQLESRNSSPETYRQNLSVPEEKPQGLLGRVKSLRIKR